MTRAVEVGGYGLWGRGIVRGLRVGKEEGVSREDVRICFVVSWKKIGSEFDGVEEGSVKSSFLSDLGVSKVVFMCFSNASSAFVSYSVSITVSKGINVRYLSFVQVCRHSFALIEDRQNFLPQRKCP